MSNKDTRAASGGDSASLEQRARSLLPDGWTHDCQGKQDYDADLLALSCRYYPANYQRNGKAAVSAAVVWGEGDERLFHATLEAETESQVKAMAESWAAEKIVAIRAALANQQGVEKDAARYRWLRDSRACSMQVSFNDHHNMYMSVSETMKNSQEYYDDTSAGEREKMVATDTIWTVHIYPNTPVGFNVYHAATLDTAIDAAMSTQPAGDVGRERE